MIDRVDKEILKLLQQNGRLSLKTRKNIFILSGSIRQDRADGERRDHPGL